VSVATITRITRGDTYRDARAPDPVEVIPPATPPVPEPEQGEQWDEPPRRCPVTGRWLRSSDD
jgi:hypothetical protein